MSGYPDGAPADGTRGFGFTTGGGVRFVYAAIALSFDITLVRVQLHKDAKHDPRDELGLMDEPAVDLAGNVIAWTFGLGFVL